MLYQFIVTVFDLYQKLMCLKFFQNILIFFCGQTAGILRFFSKYFKFPSVILCLSSYFSVKFSLLFSRVAAEYLLDGLLLGLGKCLELD